MSGRWRIRSILRRTAGSLLAASVVVAGSPLGAMAAPPSELLINDVTVTEGNSGTVNASFTVTLRRPPKTGTVTVDYASADGTATQPSDFTGASGNLSLSKATPTRTVSVPVVGDALDEPNETFTVNLSNAVGATIRDGIGLGTITDDDAPPTISVADASVTEGNAGTRSLTFTVSLAGASGKTVGVSYATADATATAGSDYVAAAGSLSFAPSETSKTVDVTANGDTLDESNEGFTLDLSGATNATIADAQGVGTITDDDPTPSLSVADVSVAEGDAGTVTATFTVSLSSASGRTVTVDYSTAAVTATAPDDYSNKSGTLTFSAGQASKTVSVTVKGDLLDEPAETFTIDLSNPADATVADAQGVGTITDDDPMPSLSVGDVTLPESDLGATATFTVSLSAASGRTVSVDYTTTDGTADATDYTGVSGTLTFSSGETSKTVDVAIAGDGGTETDETFTFDLSNQSNATLPDPQGLATIVNDDSPVDANVSNATLTEGTGATKTMLFTVSLTGPRGVDVTVDYATADGTALQPGDYAPKSGTLTFTAGETSKTVAVTIKGDSVDEPNETFTLDLSNPVNVTIGDGTGVGTIKDNDKGNVILTITVQKKPKVIQVRGLLTPAHAGKRVTVTLFKRTASGSYKKKSTKRVTLGSPVDPNNDGVMSSRYTAKFPKPAKGRYKVTVRFAGDAGHFGKTSTKLFRI